MANVRILGKKIKIRFKRGVNSSGPIDEARILQGVGEMAALINSKTWPPNLAQAYTGLKKIVFFNGKVKVNNVMVERPGIDERKAAFFWELAEFNRDDADGHANTLFHDGWHVVQFKRAGNRHAHLIDERVAREVDAVDRQIEAATILGSSADDIAFLVGFRNDPARIRARLLEGIG